MVQLAIFIAYNVIEKVLHSFCCLSLSVPILNVFKLSEYDKYGDIIERARFCMRSRSSLYPGRA